MYEVCPRIFRRTLSVSKGTERREPERSVFVEEPRTVKIEMEEHMYS